MLNGHGAENAHAISITVIMCAVVAPIYSAGSSDKHIVECRNDAHGTHCRDGDVGVAHAQRAVRGRQSAYFTMCCATLVFYAPMS